MVVPSAQVLAHRSRAGSSQQGVLLGIRVALQELPALSSAWDVGV